MEVPSKGWPEAILKSGDLETIREDFGSCKDEITAWVEHKYADGLSKGETPEKAALVIGNFAFVNHRDEDYFYRVVDEFDETEGEQLAIGYIGTQAIEEADC